MESALPYAQDFEAQAGGNTSNAVTSLLGANKTGTSTSFYSMFKTQFNANQSKSFISMVTLVPLLRIVQAATR